MDGVVKSKLTSKSDKRPHEVKLKVFWVTKRRWTEADIADYQRSVKGIADQLYNERYWDKDGDIKRSKFTCEDFAIRVLCQYAAAKGLPVKLTTGVGTYRNMELYDAARHDGLHSSMHGFAEWVMLTYGARDMQLTGKNTVKVGSVDELMPGDVLAQAKDRKDKFAHHIQLVTEKLPSTIFIYQGNSGVGNKLSPLYRIFGMNPANPRDGSYTGEPVQKGAYRNIKGKWNYKRDGTSKEYVDFLLEFEFYRFNFFEFNR